MVIKFLRKLVFFIVGLSLLTVGIVIIAYLYVSPDLPSASTIKQIQVQSPLRVYSKDNKLISTFGDKRRIPIDLEKVPQDMINAFLAAEDDRFYKHIGIDVAGLVRATINLIQTGERRQGGSTITMQLARNFFLTKQRTFERKAKEIFLALIIERLFTKDEILNLYLNKIFLGKRAYGVAAASEVYYGLPIEELNLAQIAMIAGLPKAPSRYNPISNPNKAIERRSYVLDRMLELSMIDENTYGLHSKAPITAKQYALNIELDAPHIAEMVRKQMIDKYGEEAYTRGFKVYTSIQSTLQESANLSIQQGLKKYDKRHGWRGGEKQIEWQTEDFADQVQKTLSQLTNVGGLKPAIVTNVSDTDISLALKENKTLNLPRSAWQWARPYLSENAFGETPETGFDVVSTGSIVRITPSEKTKLAQIPAINGALIAMNPKTGSILALVGGFDFHYSKFNRVTQAKRQPGSNFKPFIYSAALSKGYTPASIVVDTPVVFANNYSDWRPENYSGQFFGPTRLRNALKFSRNLISVKLVDDIGIDESLDFVRRFGFERKNHPHNMTLALGSGTVTPLELARGYAVFANGGFYVEPYLIERIEVDEQIIHQVKPLSLCNTDCDDSQQMYARRVIPADIAYQMTSMMRDVIKEGTGRRARVLRRNDIAGKTGTTNEQRDTWFSGYNQDIVCSVWIGFDNHKPLGKKETGSRAALPIWIDFMRDALEGKSQRKYKIPTNIVTARIDRENGLLAHPSDEKSISETFRRKYLPTEIAKPKSTNDQIKEYNDDLF